MTAVFGDMEKKIKCSVVSPLRARARITSPYPRLVAPDTTRSFVPDLDSFNTPRLRARVNLRARVKKIPPQPRQRPWRGPWSDRHSHLEARPQELPIVTRVDSAQVARLVREGEVHHVSGVRSAALGKWRGDAAGCAASSSQRRGMSEAASSAGVSSKGSRQPHSSPTSHCCFLMTV